jgi:hypothetical protein
MDRKNVIQSSLGKEIKDFLDYSFEFLNLKVNIEGKISDPDIKINDLGVLDICSINDEYLCLSHQ